MPLGARTPGCHAAIVDERDCTSMVGVAKTGRLLVTPQSDCSVVRSVTYLFSAALALPISSA